MGILKWFGLEKAPAGLKTQPCVVRLALGSFVVDFRQLPTASLLDAAVVLASVKTQLNALGPPDFLVAWVVPVAAFPTPDALTSFVSALSSTMPMPPVANAMVIAGSAPGKDALAFTSRSMGMTVFAIGDTDAVPIAEALTAGGQLIRGMTGKPVA